MDSVPRLSQPLAAPAANHGGPSSGSSNGSVPNHAGQDPSAEAGEDPYSSGLQAFPKLLGSLIALTTLILPLATVLAARVSVPLSPYSYGSAPAAGLPSARSGEHRGGDPSRQPQ
jgi:hypothetical protein